MVTTCYFALLKLASVNTVGRKIYEGELIVSLFVAISSPEREVSVYEWFSNNGCYSGVSKASHSLLINSRTNRAEVIRGARKGTRVSRRCR